MEQKISWLFTAKPMSFAFECFQLWNVVCLQLGSQHWLNLFHLSYLWLTQIHLQNRSVTCVVSIFRLTIWHLRKTIDWLPHQPQPLLCTNSADSVDYIKFCEQLLKPQIDFTLDNYKNKSPMGSNWALEIFCWRCCHHSEIHNPQLGINSQLEI